jgi:hypothetical protein
MLTDKKLAKIEKELGPDALTELAGADLEAAITNAAGAIKTSEDELEANPKYQELKESMKAVKAGLGEVKKRQKAIIDYCLHLLEERGAK